MNHQSNSCQNDFFNSGLKSAREEEDSKKIQELEERQMKQHEDLLKLEEENKLLRQKCELDE